MVNLKKKIFVLIFVLIMVTSIQVFAEGDVNIEKAEELVEEANKDIYELIEKAKEKDSENPGETQEIIAELINETEELSTETKEEGEELGIEIICEYIEVDINGIIVLIDPLRVAGW